LGAVEKGIVTLIGATTENPSFEVNSAFAEPLPGICAEAPERGRPGAAAAPCPQHRRGYLKKKKVTLKKQRALIRISGGDARKLLNLLEVVYNAAGKGAVITDELVMEMRSNASLFMTRKGSQHYDINLRIHQVHPRERS